MINERQSGARTAGAGSQSPRLSLPPGPMLPIAKPRERASHLPLRCFRSVLIPRIAALLVGWVVAVNGAAVAQQGQPEAARPAFDPVAEVRQSLMGGPLGQAPIERVVQAVTETHGTALQTAYLTLAVRKKEALPAVLDKLRSGSPYEKRMMTKVLRYLGWEEAVPTLVEIVSSDSEHWLARQGSLYALGAIGDPAAGPTLVRLLDKPDRSATEIGITIAALGRIAYGEAGARIKPFLAHANARVRIASVRALAEIGEKPDASFLLEATHSNDDIVRQEACAALALVAGDVALARLKSAAATDGNASVRREARIALARCELSSLTTAERARVVERMLEDEDEFVRAWGLAALATQCAEPGRAVLRRHAKEDTATGRASRSWLVVLQGAGPRFRGAY